MQNTRNRKDGFTNDSMRIELLKAQMATVRTKLEDAGDAVDKMERLLTKPIEPERGQQLPLFPQHREEQERRAE